MGLRDSIYHGEWLSEGGEMGWKGVRVTSRQVGSFGWRFPFSLLHQISVVLLGVIFLLSVETGWGVESRKVLVSTGERSTHVARLELVIREGKIEAPFWVNGEHRERRSILVAGSPSRTSRSLVNTVMALLATFDDVGVLPPEGTTQANQIIHALIQLQSAVVKTSDPELQRFLEESIRIKVGKDWKETYHSLPRIGLTSMVFEALVSHDSQSGLWKQDGVARAFRQFNLTEEDWVVVKTIFLRARDVYTQQGVSIHDAFSVWLKKMS